MISWLSGGELVGGWTSSNYPGHGVPFEELPTDGDSGGSPLLDDGGVAGDEIRWGPATVTSGAITVTLFEDGSFESMGGAGGFSYPWWRNGVQQSDQDVVINSAGATVSFAMPQFAVETTADNEAPVVDATIAFNMPQFTTTISAENTVPISGATVSFAMPQFVVAATAESSVPVTDAAVHFTMPQFIASVSASSLAPDATAVSFVMPQFIVAVSAETTAPEIAATVTFTMPQFSAQVFSGEFDYHNSDGSEFTYVAESTEITYTSESTQIEWRA